MQRAVFVVVCAAFAALSLAAVLAVAGGPTKATATGTGTSVTIEGFAFGPKVLQVRKGTTVEFTNKDAAPHTATASDGSFDTGLLKNGQKGSVKVERTTEYICDLHPSMKATVEVVV